MLSTMRIRRHLPTLLLGLGLLLTQWLSFAHALEHPALSQDKACAVCLLGINIDSGAPLAKAPALALSPQAEDFRIASTLFTRDLRPVSTRARAPPQSLV